MASYHTNFDEFHHGEKEYCRNSGPLNSRKTGFPSHALLNGLALVTATAVSTVLVVALAALYLLSSPRAIGAHSATVNVNIYNRPSDTVISYVLTAEDDPNTVVAEGVLTAEQQVLTFDDLAGGTKYTICYYSQSSNGDAELLKTVSFTTLEEQNEVPPPDPVPEPTPDPDPEPNPEPKPEPKPETKPEIRPETKPEPTISAPEAMAATVDSVTTLIIDDILAGYQITQTHSFQGVLSDACTVQISQNGVAVSSYTTSYDEVTQVMTVTVLCNDVASGDTADTQVVLTCEDGGTATSNLIVTAPKLVDAELTVTELDDHQYRFAVNGTFTAPDPGDVQLQIRVVTSAPDDSVLTIPVTFSGSNFSGYADHRIIAPGLTLTAEAEIALLWSEQTDSIAQILQSQADYTVDDPSELTFTDVTLTDGYTVQAVLSAPDIATVDAVTYTLFIGGDDAETSDEYNFSVDDYVINEDGTVTAIFQVTANTLPDNDSALYLHFGSKLTWTAELEYTDTAGVSHTAFCTDDLWAPSAEYWIADATVWEENGVTYAAFTFTVQMNDFGPGVIQAPATPGTPIYPDSWQLVDGTHLNYAYSGNTIVISGSIYSADDSDPVLHIHYDWSATEEIEQNYCGTSFSLGASSISSSYDAGVQSHTFSRTNFAWNEYDASVLVTLADGTTTSVVFDGDFGETTDLTGLISVFWDVDGNTVVTVDSSLVGTTTVQLTIDDHYGEYDPHGGHKVCTSTFTVTD